jgi:adenylate cyclase
MVKGFKALVEQFFLGKRIPIIEFLNYSLFLFIIPGLWILASYLGLLRGLESLCLNSLYIFRGEKTAPVKLVYVDVDSKAIEVMGERPFPRSFYAVTVDALFRYGKIKAVGIDIVFSDSAQSFLTDPKKVMDDNAVFREVVGERSHLVLAAAYTPRTNILAEVSNEVTEFPLIYRGFSNPDTNALPEQPGIRLIGTEGGTLGLINVDETMPLTLMTSWVPLFAYTPGPTYYTMALQLYRLYHDLPMSAIRIESDCITIKNEEGSIMKTIPMRFNQLIEVNWFSKFFSDQNPRCSLRDILVARDWLENGTVDQKKQAQDLFSIFENAIVFIGPVDPMLQDLSPTPFDKEPVPRVGIHGNLLKTIFSDSYIERWPMWAQAFIVYVVSVVVFVLAMYSGLYSGLLKLTSLLLVGLYVAVSFWVFRTEHLVLPMVAPVGAALSTAFVGVIYKLLYEEKQKSRIKNLFGTYVSPELVSQMIEAQDEPTLGGVEETITALFSDIQNFSTFSEVLVPHRLVELMNEYLSAMTDILQAEMGTLDKYIGDAIVAMFGAPVKVQDHAYRACIAANTMQTAQLKLRQIWAKDKRWPKNIMHMHTRIGLNSGRAIIGNMGSSTRFNYTMMGDTVNLAARCESGAKQYGVYTLVTQSTKQEAEKYGKDLVFRLLDTIIVKGRSQPVRIFELMGLKSTIGQQSLECIGYFEQAMEVYLAQDWLRAEHLFGQSLRLEPLKQDYEKGIYTNPSLVFIDRCKRLAQVGKMPENWDGVYRMDSK